MMYVALAVDRRDCIIKERVAVRLTLKSSLHVPFNFAALTFADAPVTVAVMGCEVNGPGEAREADIGVAGGHQRALIFMKGEKVGLVDYEDIKENLVGRVEKLAAEYAASQVRDGKEGE